MRRMRVILVLLPLILGATAYLLSPPYLLDEHEVQAQSVPTLRWGSSGQTVRTLQWRLQQWGYHQGSIDGVYGAGTYRAVTFFQRRNGVYPADGVVGQKTWRALGLLNAGATGRSAQAVQAGPVAAVNRSDQLNLLSRVVAAEAEGEPFEGQVAVAAVILNRIEHPGFPNSLSGVVYQPHAFESVSNGLVWRRTPSDATVRAARNALNGWDPTYGAIFFWNPSKPVVSWIWSRPIIVRIGNHIFAR